MDAIETEIVEQDGRSQTLNIATTSQLVVPAGTPLIPDRLYLQLYHGRKDPNELMDDWGFTGPTFGPLNCVVQTYLTTIRLHGESVHDELWLAIHDDMIVWEGAYYGDFSIFVASRPPVRVP